MSMLTLNKRLEFSHRRVWVAWVFGVVFLLLLLFWWGFFVCFCFNHCHLSYRTESFWKRDTDDCCKEWWENHFCWSDSKAEGLFFIVCWLCAVHYPLSYPNNMSFQRSPALLAEHGNTNKLGLWSIYLWCKVTGERRCWILLKDWFSLCLNWG